MPFSPRRRPPLPQGLCQETQAPLRTCPAIPPRSVGSRPPFQQQGRLVAQHAPRVALDVLFEPRTADEESLGVVTAHLSKTTVMSARDHWRTIASSALSLL